ncbi:MAG TPA: PrsW family intramembrane metalloprotease [Acidimicrobiia bacterium]|jgi:RsiW-degrading membrane proteinase PrsW (M82 family)
MSDTTLVFLAGIAPAVIWMGLFWFWDRNEREPFGLIIGLFLMGFLVVAPIAGIINGVAAALFGGGSATGTLPLLVVVVVAPVSEETLKYLGARIVAFNRVAFTEPVDGMVYGTAVGLGFAAVENVTYLISTMAEIDAGTLVFEACARLSSTQCSITTVLPIRAFGSTLIHALASGLAGYVLTRRKFANRPDLLPSSTFPGLLAAIGLHAAWNLGMSTGNVLWGIAVLVVGALTYRRLFRRCIALSPRARAGPAPAPT